MTTHTPDRHPHPTATRTSAWTVERVRDLGVVTDLGTAAQILKIGRSLAYQLAASDDFPVPVIRAGRRYRVPIAGILTALGLSGGPRAVTDADHHIHPVTVDAAADHHPPR
jgi:hypothetical protein